MRTDRFWLCVECAVRFCAPPCPRCGGRAVLDGREVADDRDALATLRRLERRRAWRAHWRRVRTASLRFLPAAPLAIPLTACFWFPGLLLLTSGSAPGDGKILLGVGVVMMIAPLLGFVVWPYPMLGPEGRRQARAEERERRARDVPAVAIDPTTEASGATATSYAGLAEGHEALVAPVSGVPCLAWRIVGQGPAGAIDDADIAGFEVVTEQGRVGVTASGACVHLAPAGAAHTTLTEPALDELERRWAFPRHGRVRVKEAVLRAGDRVAVSGALVEELHPEGYRGQTARLVLRATDEIRLLVEGVRAARDQPR